jgi:hypothetical protein
MHRRQSKFTPANIRQIVNLLERGKSKEEIAEIIGVTPATLQVTCSKLGISLRRPGSGASYSLARLRRPASQNGKTHDVQERTQESIPTDDPTEQVQTARKANPVDEEQAVVPLHPKRGPTRKSGSCSVALTMRYKGEERTIDLPLDRDLLGLFALEAEFRSMSVGNLIGQMLHSVAKNDRFGLLLEQAPGRSK